MASIAAPLGVGQCPYVVDSASREVGACTTQMMDKMRSTERQMQYNFSGDLPYIATRRVLVDWLCEISAEFSLARATAHVAAAYMDKFLHCTEMAQDKYQLIALACLILAAKYEEAEEAVPPLKDLKKYCDIDGREPSIDKLEVNRMEVLILTHFNWCMTAVVPQHALGLFLRQGVVFQGDSMMGKPLVPEVPAYLQRYSDFFAELVCQQADFQRYLPTLSAAAIVVATRRAVNLLPNWTPQLQAVLGYTAQQVQGPFLHLWLHYADAFPQQTAVTDAQFKDTVAAAVETYRGVPPLKAVLHLQAQQATQNTEHTSSLAAASVKSSSGRVAEQVTPNGKLSMSQRSDSSACTPGSSLTPGAHRGFGAVHADGAGGNPVAHADNFAQTAGGTLGGGGGSNPYLSSARVGASGHSGSGLTTQRPALGSQPINIQVGTSGMARSKGFVQAGALPVGAGSGVY